MRYVKNGRYVAGSKTGQRIGMLELKAFGGLRLEVDGAPYGGIAARPKTLGLPNPKALVMTLFVFLDGWAAGEDGSLVYYRILP